MKLVIDQSKCKQHGQCQGAAPTLIGFGDDGKAHVYKNVLEADDIEVAQDAVSLCPEQAITLVDD
ncbi:MAG: ferredoxin [Polyangiales bacterium]